MERDKGCSSPLLLEYVVAVIGSEDQCCKMGPWGDLQKVITSIAILERNWYFLPPVWQGMGSLEWVAEAAILYTLTQE